ncbi:co-chaperone GroES [Sulfurimonas marina]|uniref:Co-chaperonin GroES n=1 Tax=Sulfurimonas marina TaxID=2590551 RepID=A0A7M1AW69_9BACT|nr:co-chaperone GroES [Sulfurimonas marina]QOP41697.1 co-chaperone GroES [Sulfurimonas marina]
MNFKPLGERILVKSVEESNTTASGIIIPDNAKEKPNRAEVIAISEEITNVNVGDTVVYGKYSGTQIALEGQDYIVLELADVLGVIS